MRPAIRMQSLVTSVVCVLTPVGAVRPATDYPHLDSTFPHGADNLLKNVPRETAAQIPIGRAHLYGLTEADFQKAAVAATAKLTAASAGH